jgi:hypothetical protein
MAKRETHSLFSQRRSMAEGRSIQDSVRQKMETDELERRKRSVNAHVPPPSGVPLDALEGMAADEKATRMFPTMLEEMRRKMGLAPMAPPPTKSLDWWRK